MKFLDRSHECPVQFTNRTNANNGVENPLYTYWVDEDSAIIMWINSKISDMLIYYFANASTPYELWKGISDKFACISSTHSIQLRTKLLTIKKGNSFIVANTIEIKMITNELAACGYIISDMKLWLRNPTISSIELHTLLLSEDIVCQSHLTVNNEESTYRAFFSNARGYSRGTRGFNPSIGGRGFGRGFGRQSGTLLTPSTPFPTNVTRPADLASGDKPTCHLCRKYGHPADECWSSMNFAYQGRDPLKHL
ncbi:uncharacterized protein LOC113323987 [Papaver somniferum]|uniref:uncharacterized protein LOC113323986 n=1 Tax=Papaver somniferum TaxID=3469 RepID=UPI000E702CD7|nr:uncharacterized protein LOC113323986 [Papaver somniferum]XP_026428118.1 uncharacterized protein LOC113323987 [Papaver somniferum]